MLPALRARSQETEEQRTLPDATRQELVDGGFYRIFQPEGLSSISSRS